jgi:hypothetical protein
MSLNEDFNVRQPILDYLQSYATLRGFLFQGLVPEPPKRL